MNFSDNWLMNVHWSSAGVESKIVNFIQIKHGKLHGIVIFMTSIPGSRTDRDHNCIIYKRSEVGPDHLPSHVVAWKKMGTIVCLHLTCKQKGGKERGKRKVFFTFAYIKITSGALLTGWFSLFPMKLLFMVS